MRPRKPISRELREDVALLGCVYGVRQDELSTILAKNGSQLAALRQSARAKLIHSMKLI